MKRILPFICMVCLYNIQAFSQTNFIKSQSIVLPLPGGNAPYNIASGFIDDDNFVDLVISITIGDRVYWLKNDGTGSFTLQSTPIGILDNAGGVAIGDLNNDGFNDVVSTSYNAGKLVWFENDGLGNFGTEQIISSTLLGPSQVYIRTIDADDIPDVAVSSYSGNEVVWFANDGFGNFGTKNSIDNTILSPGAFAMQDIDGDGDIDSVIANAVAFGVPNDCRIEVFYNDGNGIFTSDTNVVSLNTKDYIFSVMAEDIDGDGSRDILVTDITGVPSYFKRTELVSGTAIYVETILTTSIVNPACLDLQDLDNDGLSDFVLSSATSGAGNDIVWFKNDGMGGFDPELVIDATQSQAYTFTFNDFDNDGDTDIASIAYNDDRVNVFNNQLITLGLHIKELNGVSIYPNPIAETVNFKGLTQSEPIIIYDMVGNIILRTNLQINQSLEVSNLKSGVYLVKFERSNSIYKVIKQ